ncbi:MAG TPA: S-layer homology domain-containing protein [Oscillatoriaceae cyanobacterium]
MRPGLLPTTALVWTLCAATAFAQTASDQFKDVPADHWAASAVTDVAVKHHFMQGYPDGTFRGDTAFTRLQLALAVNELIKGLEGLTNTSWANPGQGGFDFTDLPADPTQRAIVLKLANRYGIFDGVPGVTSRTFEGQKQVSRYEMAHVIDRLLRLGETKGVVDPAVLTPHAYAFGDVPDTAWDYQSVHEVADRYQVMVGFPDGTFRGPELLTRYQFAASASQTFPLVTQLVQKTQEKHEQQQAAALESYRYLESAPLQLGVTARLGGPIGPAFTGRFAHYWGPVFLLADTTLGAQNMAGDRLYDGDVNLGWALPLGGTFHLQPYIGARAVSNVSSTLGAFDYGAIGYWRPSDSWGIYGQLNGSSGLGATAGNAQGVFLPGAALGLEYYFTPKLGLTLQGRYDALPVGLGGTPTVDGATSGTLGVNLGF